MTGGNNSQFHIDIPEKVAHIISVITEAGFEAYAVGGCVRDTLLGRVPNDWDITTSAKPEQVKALFRRTVDTGIEHGTVTVMLDKEGFEVTTYRIDGEYEDSRHPKEVVFTPDLKEDLRRRDFTINAMAYNDEVGLVDIFGGTEDLRKGIIRCVGVAKERFTEDALRMMRAIRFSAQLGYEIEAETLAAIRELAPNLSKISAERIETELEKTLLSDHPDYIRKAYETGITAVVLPEIDRAIRTTQNNPHHCYTVGEHILHSLMYVPADKVLRFTMLLHDIAKPHTKTTDERGIDHFVGHPEVGEKVSEEIMRRLKMDNDTIRKVCVLVKHHDYGLGVEPTRKIVRKAINRIGADIFPRYLMVRRADLSAQSDYHREEKMENIRRWGQIYEEIMAAGECVELKSLAVTGRDLIAAGIKPGPRMGEILNGLLEEVLEEPSKNDADYLLFRALELDKKISSK